MMVLIELGPIDPTQIDPRNIRTWAKQANLAYFNPFFILNFLIST